MGELTLEILQKLMFDWKVKNFGGKVENGHQQLLGIIEEYGELAHAILKEEQGVRINENFEEGKKDAIGDIIIFLLNYLSEKKIFVKEEYSIVIDDKPEWFYFLNINKYLEDIIEAQFLIEEDKLNYPYSIVMEKIKKSTKGILTCLATICNKNDWELNTAVKEVWGKVSQRDWNKNKVDGKVDTGKEEYNDDKFEHLIDAIGKSATRKAAEKFPDATPKKEIKTIFHGTVEQLLCSYDVDSNIMYESEGHELLGFIKFNNETLYVWREKK